MIIKSDFCINFLLIIYKNVLDNCHHGAQKWYPAASWWAASLSVMMGSSARSALGPKLPGSRWPQVPRATTSAGAFWEAPHPAVLGWGSGLALGGLAAALLHPRCPGAMRWHVQGWGKEDPWVPPVGDPSLWRGCGRAPGVHPGAASGSAGAGGKVGDSSMAAALLGSNERPNFEHPLTSTRGCSHRHFTAPTGSVGAPETRPPWKVKPVTLFGVATGCCSQVAHCRWLRWPHRHLCLGEAAQGCSAHSGSRTQREKQPQGSSLAGREENSAGNQGFCAMQATPEELCSGYPGLRSPPSPQGDAAFASSSGRPKQRCQALLKRQLQRSFLAFQSTGV